MSETEAIPTTTLVCKDGKPVLAISVAGGDMQDQAALQILINTGKKHAAGDPRGRRSAAAY